MENKRKYYIITQGQSDQVLEKVTTYQIVFGSFSLCTVL